MMAKEIQGNLFTVCRIEVDTIPATLCSHLGRADTCTLGRVKRSLQGLADGFPSMMGFCFGLPGDDWCSEPHFFQ